MPRSGWVKAALASAGLYGLFGAGASLLGGTILWPYLESGGCPGG